MNNKKAKMYISELPVILCTILYCTSFIINDLGLSITIYAGTILVLSIATMLLSLTAARRVMIQEKILTLFLLYIIVLISSFHNYDFSDYTKTFYLIIATLSVVVFAVTQYMESTVKRINGIILITGLFFSTSIYVFRLFPDAVKSIVYSFVTAETISQIEFITNQGYGFFFNSDIAYTLCIILFAIFIALFDNPKSPKIIVALYLIGALLLSQRRTEIIFGLITIAVMYLFVFFDNVRFFVKKHGILFLVFLIAIIMAAVCFVVWYCSIDNSFTSDNRILMTLYGIKYHIDISNGRSVIKEIAFSLLEDNWFLGIGWMNFQHYGKLSGISMIRNVHNIYMQLILECGIILGMIFIVILFILAVRCMKKVKFYNLSGAGCAMFLYILFGGLTDNTIYYPYAWIMIGISLYMSGFSIRKYLPDE